MLRKAKKIEANFVLMTVLEKNKNKQVPYQCDYCGKEFFTRKSKVDNRLNEKSKYLCCSSECAKEIQKPKWEDIVLLFE